MLAQLGASQHAPTYATERRKTKTSLDQRAKRRAKARSNVPPVQQDGLGPPKSGNIARKMFSTTAENVLAKLRRMKNAPKNSARAGGVQSDHSSGAAFGPW